MSHSGSRRDALMGCAKQHVALPASIWEVQFAQLLRRSGPNIPQAAVANQRGRPAMHATRLTSGLPGAADLTSWERGHAAVEVDRLMEGSCDPLRATDGCNWWPPVHLEMRETCLFEKSPTPPYFQVFFYYYHRPPVEQSCMTAYTRKLHKMHMHNTWL